METRSTYALSGPAKTAAGAGALGTVPGAMYSNTYKPGMSDELSAGHAQLEPGVASSSAARSAGTISPWMHCCCPLYLLCDVPASGTTFATGQEAPSTDAARTLDQNAGASDLEGSTTKLSGAHVRSPAGGASYASVLTGSKLRSAVNFVDRTCESWPS